jgi:flagellin-specific chaperone FliS
MNGHLAYQRQQVALQPRIDIVLALYRKTLELISRSRVAGEAGQTDDVRGLLGKAQLIVNSLALGMVGSPGETALNFVRLYEFVNDKLASGNRSDLDAAEEVMRILLEGFETARAEAVALEASGALPAFGSEHTLLMTT